jgi:hypothetical protein
MTEKGETEKKKNNRFYFYNFIMFIGSLIITTIGFLWFLIENILTNHFWKYWTLNLFPAFLLFFGLILIFISISIFEYELKKKVNN